MANETEYIIRLYGRDLAGNELSESIYSFVTFAMENGYGKTPEIRYLFAIDQKHVADLDKENITQDLAKEFTDNGFELPPDPRISVGQEGVFWMIYGQDLEHRAYYLMHSVDRIDVYELGYIAWL